MEVVGLLPSTAAVESPQIVFIVITKSRLKRRAHTAGARRIKIFYQTYIISIIVHSSRPRICICILVDKRTEHTHAREVIRCIKKVTIFTYFLSDDVSKSNGNERPFVLFPKRFVLSSNAHDQI